MPGGRPGDDDDEVALLDAADVEQLLVDLGDHLVGVLDRGRLERLDPPGQRELGAGLGLGGERQDRDRPTQRDIRRAESPDWVNATTYFASIRSATSPAALAITPDFVCGSQAAREGADVLLLHRVHLGGLMMRAIVSTVWTGYSPTPVSPESITASAPSRIALATSETSARVGGGLEIIDSSIWVATMTGLALRRALSMIFFCRNGTSSAGTPRRGRRGPP